MVIRRRLYDYMKKQSKSLCEMPVNPYSFGDDINEEDISIKQQIMDKTETSWDNGAKWEIEAISTLLKEYGISFFDLVSVSPKANKTKTACAKAIAFISQNQILLEQMRKSKNLPVKAIEKNINIPKKILERHRKYIIAAVEIITRDYPILSEYLKFVKEEFSK
jgi:RNA polymerase sigma factor